MTIHGTVVLWIIGIIYSLWVIQLTRTRKLYVGYAVIWFFWAILGLLAVTFQPLLSLITNLVGAEYPTSALTLLAFGLLFAMQIYLLSQVSIMSRRLAAIAQFIAMHEIDPQAKTDK